ncbi:hypothetical protein D7231_32075 [Streptomyces klenkii]|uniref:Uncharacterized protein n=1 Tax=Streptomyces klenkii TaxID=1420899 RepID=A0A3B0AMG1_9ACTN|nr:hypothetical protein [Streptomyces klenkii]RKN61910.1 hypothetical protein D7231_32075 [Streptomyces klenkii]
MSEMTLARVLDATFREALTLYLPLWEAWYEPGNVSTYLIGYTNGEPAARAAAEGWLRSERGDTPGRLEWVPEPTLVADGEFDAWLTLLEHHADGACTDTGISIRRRVEDGTS